MGRFCFGETEDRSETKAIKRSLACAMVLYFPKCFHITSSYDDPVEQAGKVLSPFWGSGREFGMVKA